MGCACLSVGVIWQMIKQAPKELGKREDFESPLTLCKGGILRNLAPRSIALRVLDFNPFLKKIKKILMFLEKNLCSKVS